MRLDPIGHVENPEELDLEPITIPVCGVTRDAKTKKPKSVCEDFNFRPSLPWGNTFSLIEAAERGVAAMAGNTVKWIKTCLVSDEERERFQEFLTNPGIEIEQQTIEALYEALAEAYSSRPTLPRTGSSGTGGSIEETSKGGSSASASKSRKKA